MSLCAYVSRFLRVIGNPVDYLKSSTTTSLAVSRTGSLASSNAIIMNGVYDRNENPGFAVCICANHLTLSCLVLGFRLPNPNSLIYFSTSAGAFLYISAIALSAMDRFRSFWSPIFSTRIGSTWWAWCRMRDGSWIVTRLMRCPMHDSAWAERLLLEDCIPSRHASNSGLIASD